MELAKLKIDDIRGYETARLKQVEDELHEEMLKMRMDVFSTGAKNVGKIRGLRKSLARVKTAQGEKVRKQVMLDKRQASKKGTGN